MKNAILLSCLFFAASLSAQITTPPASPAAKIEQQVGLTDISVAYARPAAKSRTIYGDLVPFGKTWRTGANATTKISFSTDVEIIGNALKKGTYGLYTVPHKDHWEIIFYTDAEGWGVPRDFSEKKVALRVKTTPMETAMYTESFHIYFDNLSTQGGTLFLKWEKTLVPVNFKVPTDKTVMANIDRVFSGPNPDDYYAAAIYYFQEGKNIKKAKEWIDKALGDGKDARFWQLRQKALIYHAAGDKKGAIEAAKQSLDAAQQANNEDYVKMNRASLKAWGA